MSANFKTCIGYQVVSYAGKIQDLCHPPFHLAKSGLIDSDLKSFQWLTTGYYFWMNSIIPAEQWMKHKEKRARALNKDMTLGGHFNRDLIIKCDIVIERNKVFDLTENPDDEKYLFELLDAYCHLCNGSIRQEIADKLPEPSISVVLHYFREKHPDIFPYRAITIADRYDSPEHWRYQSDSDKKSYLKILPLANRSEEYKGVGRPQICVFEGAEGVLTNPELMCPEGYHQLFKRNI